MLRAFLVTGFALLGGSPAIAGDASGGDKARAEADEVLLSRIGAFLPDDKATTVEQTAEEMRARFRQLDAQVEGDSTPSEEYPISSELRIVRKIRLPVGLTGAHSVRFVPGKGVRVPHGDPGHSAVVSEETGAILPIGLGRRRHLHPGRI